MKGKLKYLFLFFFNCGNDHLRGRSDYHFIYRANNEFPKLKIKFKDLAGFRAWYYLQHSVNYKGNFKPFITHAIFYEDLEIQL